MQLLKNRLVMLWRPLINQFQPRLHTIPAWIPYNPTAVTRNRLFLPLLVLTGNHAARGYPAVVEAARRAHPEVTFRALPHLAAHPRFPELIAALARGA